MHVTNTKQLHWRLTQLPSALGRGCGAILSALWPCRPRNATLGRHQSTCPGYLGIPQLTASGTCGPAWSQWEDQITSALSPLTLCPNPPPAWLARSVAVWHQGIRACPCPCPGSLPGLSYDLWPSLQSNNPFSPTQHIQEPLYQQADSTQENLRATSKKLNPLTPVPWGH